MFSKDFKWIRLCGVILLAVTICSCATSTTRPSASDRVPQASTSAPLPAPPPQAAQPAAKEPAAQAEVVPREEPAEPAPTPRMVASLQLTEQGKMLLDRNKPDDAIAVFERAIQLNPGSGQNYFYVAEAWIMKGTMDQAREFNSLARMYLAGDTSWMPRVEAQARRIASAPAE